MDHQSIKTAKDFIDYNRKQLELIGNTLKKETTTQSDVRPLFNWKRDLGTWLGGLVGSIPIVGAIAAAWFNIGYTHFFLDGDGQVYVPVQIFQDMLNEFRKEMESLMNKKLDEMYVDLANKAFAALQLACNEYNDRVIAYEKSYGSGKSMSTMDESSIPNYLKVPIKINQDLLNSDQERLKEMIRTQHSIVLNEMDRCYVLFTQGTTDQNKLLVGNLFTSTLLYVLLQRDVYYKGEEFGYPKDYIQRAKQMVTDRIDQTFTHVLKLYGAVLCLTDISNEKSEDIFNIYKQLAYLDIDRFPMGSQRIPIDKSTNTATIGKEYENGDNYTYIFESIQAKNEGFYDGNIESVFNCQLYSCKSFDFKVSRPTKPFTNITLYVYTVKSFVPGQPAPVVYQVNSKTITPNQFIPCKDEAQYINFPVTEYAVINVTVPSTTEFTLKVSEENLLGNHVKAVLK